MATVTFDLPEDLFAELQQAAAQRHISTESLLVELIRHDLRQIEDEQHFRKRVVRDNPKNGLALLRRVTLPIFPGQGGLTTAITDSLSNQAILDAADEAGNS